MAKGARGKTATDWREWGVKAIAEGDLETALGCFRQAAVQYPDNALVHYQLALLSDGFGEIGEAALHYTEALRVDPKMVDAARRLSSLVARVGLPANVQLNPWGLKAALDHDFVNRDQVAEATVYYLAQRGPLHAALADSNGDGRIATARQLVRRDGSALFRDDLLQKALRDSVIRHPELERLLTALRRVLLLETPLDRFEDRSLMAFVVALANQCWVNEYVWPVSEEESAHLEAHKVDVNALLAGEPAQGVRFILAALYRPAAEILDPDVSVSRVRPQIVRDFARQYLDEALEEARHAAAIRRLGVISDPVSQKVAEQYAHYPYPRWKSLGHTLRPGEWEKLLGRHFSAERLAFLSRPFEVLIAGCGTGRQAIAAAHSYGPNAKITAIDLSVPSLAYAARMADYYCASGIEFVQLDINDAGKLADFAGRFDIIECTGVLHHMSDPFAAWKGLSKCLAPQGIMLVALYSELARRDLEQLRAHPRYPGPGCGDEALRKFRAQLLEELGADSGLSGIRDIYTLSGFRDLLLHVEEHCQTIPQLQDFFAGSGLGFKGFFNAPWQRFEEMFPGDAWPGALGNWAAFEEKKPKTFAGMYQIWCERS
jgi:SAM-dependent methyltransferase